MSRDFTAAELDATLVRLFEPARPDAPDSHPQCRFPARLHWLRTRLGIDTATLPAQPCPRLEAWMAEINPAGVTLVFPSAYVNSPASMFGHTLLRIDAVGQTEAARSLGFTRSQTMYYVILPQAWRTILPPVGNEFIALLKDTSLVSILGVADLLRRGREFASESFMYFETFTMVAVVYLIITLILSKLVSFMEERLSHHVKR